MIPLVIARSFLSRLLCSLGREWATNWSDSVLEAILVEQDADQTDDHLDQEEGRVADLRILVSGGELMALSDVNGQCQGIQGEPGIRGQESPEHFLRSGDSLCLHRRMGQNRKRATQYQVALFALAPSSPPVRPSGLAPRATLSQ